jgi:hypothetical protein
LLGDDVEIQRGHGRTVEHGGSATDDDEVDAATNQGGDELPEVSGRRV